VDRQGQPKGGPFGSTLESAVAHARTLSSEERKAAMAKMQRELAALKIAEDEAEEAGSEDSDSDSDSGDDEDDDSASSGSGSHSVVSSYSWKDWMIHTSVYSKAKGGDSDKKRKKK